MADLDKARKKHEDGINNQKAALRGSLDPSAHAKATVASQTAADASSEAHTSQMKKDIYGIPIDPHYDPKKPRRQMDPPTFAGNIRRQAGQAKDWMDKAGGLFHLRNK